MPMVSPWMLSSQALLTMAPKAGKVSGDRGQLQVHSSFVVEGRWRGRTGEEAHEARGEQAANDHRQRDPHQHR